ncbi:MAG: type IX secretion system membrane protein PorP/SprF [Lewinellaceae bacterium]|nr:type IX secretion system membrane protein PorP/SprF [Lewinellaceae bacterium]
MKKGILLIAVLCSVLQLQAQQEHQFTQFMYNKLLINPAYAGARGVPSITGLYRSQWVGFEGAPTSALLSFNSPFLTPRVGVGATVSLQEIGLNRDFYGNLSYSYDLVGTDMVSLRMGIMASVRSFSIDFANAQPSQSGDQSFDVQRTSEILGNVGAGLYTTIADRFYAGFSVPRIYTNKIGFNTTANIQSAIESRHFYGMAGAILPISDDINLMPAVLVKYVKNAPFDADINLNIDIKQKVTAGLSYRLGGDGAGDSVDLLAFWQATPQIGVGAAYDFSLSKIRDYTAGSFEILLQADLKKVVDTKGRKNLSNPRFFM